MKISMNSSRLFAVFVATFLAALTPAQTRPANAPAVASEPKTESKLIFNRYGDRYFLSQVWTAGNSSGRQLLKSDREKEMAQVAKNETKGQVTLIASLSHNTR